MPLSTSEAPHSPTRLLVAIPTEMLGGRLEFAYGVGGGGGHSLSIKSATIEVHGPYMAVASYVSSSGEVPALCMPLARSTVPPNTPLPLALQKENEVIKIKDLHRLSELDVRVDARIRLVTKAFKFEDETEGSDDDDDKVHAYCVVFSPFDRHPRIGKASRPYSPAGS